MSMLQGSAIHRPANAITLLTLFHQWWDEGKLHLETTQVCHDLSDFNVESLHLISAD